jgi:ankyrin repeat protein
VIEVCEILLKSAAAGFTPLHMAANGSTDCPELCDILLKSGAKIDAHKEIEKLLLSYGADANAVIYHGYG